MVKTNFLLLPVFCYGLVGCQVPDTQFATFVSDDGIVRFQYPTNLQPTGEFKGRALLQSGWRVVWSGEEVGKGEGIVRLTVPARAEDGSAISEIVQIGRSHSPDVVETCTTYGLSSANGMSMPDRVVGGHRWMAYASSDAGMSQSIKAVNYRLVYQGTCYALDRISYAVRAAKAADDAWDEGEAGQAIDHVLGSVEILDAARRPAREQ